MQQPKPLIQQPKPSPSSSLNPLSSSLNPPFCLSSSLNPLLFSILIFFPLNCFPYHYFLLFGFSPSSPLTFFFLFPHSASSSRLRSNGASPSRMRWVQLMGLVSAAVGMVQFNEIQLGYGFSQCCWHALVQRDPTQLTGFVSAVGMLQFNEIQLS